MPFSIENLILFCEFSQPSGGGNPYTQFPRQDEIKRSLLQTLRQEERYSSIDSESCASNSLITQIRRLKEESKRPVVICFTQSFDQQTMNDGYVRWIGEIANEIGESDIFIARERSGADHSLNKSLGNYRQYFFLDAKSSGPSETEFWRAMNDLVQDVSHTLQQSSEDTNRQSIFLAPVPDGIESIANKLRRDLESRGFGVKFHTSGSGNEIDSILAKSLLSVHLFGNPSAITNSDSSRSMQIFREALAYARNHPEFRILGWTDSEAHIAHDASGAGADIVFSDRILQESNGFSLAAEVMQSGIEDFKSVLYDRLRISSTSVEPRSTDRIPTSPTTSPDTSKGIAIYVIYDPRDKAVADPVTSFLQHEGIGVLLSEFPAEQSRLREIHNENLRRCDAALIVYGAVQEQWVRMKQQDLLRASALGRKKGMSAKGVFLCSNKTEGKLRFTAADMMVIKGFDSIAALAPFIQRLIA